jgi:peptide deformylase
VAIRPIVKYGDPVLHGPARPVERVDDAIRALFDDMVETMWAAPGIGLAAPQIGVPLRVIVVDLSVGEDPSQIIRLVNPELLEREGEQRHEEGCLSIPGYAGSPVRPARVRVRGTDAEGRERVYTATELLARAFCHEIDHVDGLLFVDRLSPLRRDLLKRKLRKRAREGWESE